MTTLEITGTIFALLGVYLTVKQNIWCWPVAIIALIIYIYIFFQSKLYGDMGLQGIYILASVYGWYEWKYGKQDKHKLKVHRASIRTIGIAILVSIVLTAVLGYVLHLKTDSDVPYWDAGTTVFSLLATWMMARKQLENWIFWIIIDLLYVGIYIYKGLYVTGLQYFIFTVMAVYGLIEWRKELEKA